MSQFQCYKIISNENLTWLDARQRCKDMGGNLASISSRHEQGLFSHKSFKHLLQFRLFATDIFT